MTELDVVGAFRRQLDELPEPRRRSRRLVPAGIAAVAAVAAVAVFASGSDTSRALAITRQDGWIELRIADLDASAEAMTQELNDAGVPGRVYVAPVAPENAGTWLVAGETAWRRDNRPDCRDTTRRPTIRLNGTELGRTTVRVRVDRARETSGAFYFIAGRPAEPGETAVDEHALQMRILEDLMGPMPMRLPEC